MDSGTWSYVALGFLGLTILGTQYGVFVTMIDTVLAGQLADKWGKVFGVPSGWIVAIATVESNCDPGRVNLKSPGDVARGGAWGMLQQTLATAQDNIRQIRASDFASNPEVVANLAKWTGKGQDLLDADLGVMLGAFQLARLQTRFGNFSEVAGAYNRGAGGMSTFLVHGGNPMALNYVQKAVAALG